MYKLKRIIKLTLLNKITIISPTKYIFPFSAKLLHTTNMWRTVRIHWQCSHWGGRFFFKMCESVRSVWSMQARHKTTPSFLHRLWEDCQSPRTGLTEWSLFATAPFQLSGQVERIYWLIQCLKSIYGTPTLAWGTSNADLANTIMSRYPTKNNVFIVKL